MEPEWLIRFNNGVVEHAERLVVLCHDLELACHGDGLAALRIGGVRIRQLEGDHLRATSRAVQDVAIVSSLLSDTILHDRADTR